MSLKKGDLKHYGVGASVLKRVKDLLRQEAQRKGSTIGRVAGDILTDWCEGKVLQSEIDEVQPYLPYRQDQTEKPERVRKRPTLGKSEYRKGVFGVSHQKKKDSPIVVVGDGGIGDIP